MTIKKSADPVLAKLLEFETGLREGGHSSRHEVMVTYQADDNSSPFAICRDGLLLDPSGEPRFIPFVEIDSTSYHDGELLRNAKRILIKGAPPDEDLTLNLANGVVIRIPLNKRTDGLSERLTIEGLIEGRMRVFKAEARRKS